MSYKVIAPLVIARDGNGSAHHLYRGQVVPDHIIDDEVKRLADGGFLEELKADSGAKPASSTESKTEPKAASSTESKTEPKAAASRS